MASQLPRVMWLLNHGAARKFEIPMLKRIGITEIFLPKKMPQDISFRSGSVDFSEDAALTIPAQDLAALNEVNWYERVPAHIWEIANRHFEVLFFIAHKPAIFSSVANNFKGAAIWRAYGLDKSTTYSKVLHHCTGGLATIEKMAGRIWFGQAYDHLHEIEDPFLQSRAVFLPLGTSNELRDEWAGEDRRIFFVCPEIKSNPYYAAIYRDFKRHFGDLPHVIAGVQPIAVDDDPNVSGFVPLDEHSRNMRQLRVAYYHSTEPSHVHYHPFEAIQRGMPLVFLSGGLLDRLGGIDLPGRCHSADEARAKIKRILDGDKQLIADIRRTQPRLLQRMSFDRCEPHWRAGFDRILRELQTENPRPGRNRKARIAVILPHVYRGGTLRGAKLTAEALAVGSRDCGEECEVVLAHVDDPSTYTTHDFNDLPRNVRVRPFTWRHLSRTEARRTMRYAGHPDWIPLYEDYLAPDDGMQQFCDCDLWLFVSDRIHRPLLPIRPHIIFAFDYLQRYVQLGLGNLGQLFFQHARAAERVLVTTEFTRQDAIQFAGISPDRVVRVPMLAPHTSPANHAHRNQSRPGYFIWITNAAKHKNHANAFEALQLYYEALGGNLKCRVIGTDLQNLTSDERPHLKPLRSILARSKQLVDMMTVLGELPDKRFYEELQSAAFLWHPVWVDNGTFSVVEAAGLGVPSLSSDYPAMREMNVQFGLNLAFMRRSDPRDMAAQLKWMEQNFGTQRTLLPTPKELAAHSAKNLSQSFWREVRQCL